MGHRSVKSWNLGCLTTCHWVEPVLIGFTAMGLWTLFSWNSPSPLLGRGWTSIFLRRVCPSWHDHDQAVNVLGLATSQPIFYTRLCILVGILSIFFIQACQWMPWDDGREVRGFFDRWPLCIQVWGLFSTSMVILSMVRGCWFPTIYDLVLAIRYIGSHLHNLVQSINTNLTALSLRTSDHQLWSY